MDRAQLEQKIHSEIPLTKAIGLELISATPAASHWRAPLSPNLNHMSTGFGGSLYCATAVSCHSVVIELIDSCKLSTNEILLGQAEIKYLSPVTKDFEAKALPTGDTLEFTESLKARGRAKIPMRAEITCDGVTCAVFTGTYFVRNAR